MLRKALKEADVLAVRYFGFSSIEEKSSHVYYGFVFFVLTIPIQVLIVPNISKLSQKCYWHTSPLQICLSIRRWRLDEVKQHRYLGEIITYSI